MTTHRMENFTKIPEDNIEKLFKSAPSKSCELDPLPALLMKTHGHVLVSILADIINQSLQQGEFAQDLKEALIQPLLKKANLDLIHSNYMPISNLSFLSKLIKWAMCQQLGDCIPTTDMSEKLQLAYKVAHSTETVLIKVKNDILMSLDNKQVTCLILLDLSATFDTVSHKLLLNHLKYLCNNCWNLSNDLKKQKIFLLTDKLLQANMAASSGLRENVYPVIFIAKMFYIILFYNYYIVVILA